MKYVGNRVVQGGTIFANSAKINEKEIEQISELSKLAPLHNPGAVEAIKVLSGDFSKVLHECVNIVKEKAYSER